MIEAIKDLGLIHLNQQLDESEKGKIRNAQDFSRITVKNPSLIAALLAEKVSNQPENVKVCVISDEDGGSIYEEEYDESNYQRYLYKKPGGKKPYLSPTFKLTANIPETTRRVEEYFDKFCVNRELINLFESQKDNLKKHFYGPFEEGKTILYTFKLKDKYVIEIPGLANSFIENMYKDFGLAKKKDTHGDSVCSLCRLRGKVFGSASPMTFFTVEKEGFFPDFDCRYSWKSFPVCKGCALLLSFGKVFMENRLGTDIAHPCYLIPSFSFIEKRRDFESLDDFVNIASKQIFIKSEDIQNVKDYEDNILEQERIPLFTYHLLFYERTNSAFNIIKHIENILPSRVTKIYKVTQDVNSRYIDNRWFTIDKGNGHKLDLTFRFLNRIFNVKKAKQSGNIKKITLITSLDLVEDIFHGRKIDKNNFFADFSSHLQRIYLDQIGRDKKKIRWRLYTEVTEMTKLLEFLIEMEVLDLENAKSMTVYSEEGSLSDFFKDYEEVYRYPAKRTCFITGVLFGKLEATQLARLKSNPCLAWLKSMNLSKKEIERIFWKTIEKFKQYHNHPYPAFTERVKQVAQSFDTEHASSGEKWDMTVDEIRFFFTMGWTLYDRFLPSMAEEKKEVEK